MAERARADRRLSQIGIALATAFMAIGALDAISTNFALAVGAYEINGFMRELQDTLGMFWFVPKMLLQALVAAMIIWSPTRPTIFIMGMMTVWTATVVVNNFKIAHMLS